MTSQEIMAALAAHFDPELISWRVGPVSNGRTKPLAYLDSRDVQARLDAVMGADWSCDFVPMSDGTTCCKIGLLINEQWRFRANGAGETQVEADKGRYSAAIKRAAVMWGVGAYLYNVDAPWVQLDKSGKKIDENEMPKLHALLARHAGKANTETRAPEQRPARQEPEPSRSDNPAPVDPKVEALKRQTEHATRSAELQKSRLEEGKSLYQSHSKAISRIQERLDIRAEPVHQIARDWSSLTQTIKASIGRLTPDDQRVLRSDAAEVSSNLKHAEKFETVAA